MSTNGCRLGPEDMEAKLAELENAVEALRREDVDAVVGAEHVLLLRAKEADEHLNAHSDHLDRLVKDRTSQLIKTNTELELQLAWNKGIEWEQDRLRRALGTIMKCSEALLRASSEPEYLQEICRIVTDESGYSSCWVGIVLDEDRDSLPWAHDGDGCLKVLRAGLWEKRRDPASIALQTGRPYLARNFPPEGESLPPENVSGSASCLALPLVIEERAYGVLNICAEPDAFKEDEFRLLTRLGAEISYGVAVLRTQAQRDRAEKALYASERRYKDLADSISDVFFALDEDLRYIYWNRASEKLTGIRAEDALGKSLLEVAPDQEGEDRYYERMFRQVISTREPVYAVIPFRDHFLETSVYPAEYGVSVFIKDITERVLRERRLRRSEARLIEAQHIAQVGGWEMDLSTRRITGSDEILRICGVEPSEFGGTCEAALDLVHPEDRMRVDEAIDDAAEGKGPLDIEHRIVTPDGSVNTVRLRAQLLHELDGRMRLAGTMVDMTGTKRLEHELRTLTRRLVEVQENERRFVARELHDQTGQSLTYLSLLVDRAARVPPERIGAVLGEAKTMINELMSQIRNLSLRLRPAMLDDLGLVVALNWLFQQYMSDAGIRVNFHCPDMEEKLRLDVSTAAYRIIQEALTNVARHAGVDEVDVFISIEDDRLHLAVADRGTGFSPDSVKVSAGLSGMRERARAVDGKLTVESAPGAGTRVAAELPLHNREENNE
ncbi:MAG: PAS domain S-box protein [Dehalococcoidia bacterium]|nr:PAS domain S-box protein [Dehalococcoidia bacterium]